MSISKLEIESVIIVVICGIAIGIYWLIDPNKDMERFLHKNEKCKYYILLVVIATLSLAFTFHARHVVMHILKVIYKVGKHRLGLR